MKNFFNLSSVLATALMMTVVSCSSSDDITGGNGSGNAEGTTSYIAINLNSVGNAPTSRAYNQGEGTYDDGETNENKITSVRFYFYNADGTSYKLQTAGEKGSKNFIDLPVGDLNGGNHDNTVSGTTSAVLVLNGESNVAPATMLTVVNPDVNTPMFDGTTADRWSTMRTEMQGAKFNDPTKGFMMSNSTYEDGGKDLCTTQLTGKTYSSAADATNNPVEVFVERVNAKVKTTVGEANSNFERVTTDVELEGVNFKGKYKTKAPVGKLTTIQPDGSTKETEVYAYIEGWGLGDEDGQAMLYKQIDVQNWTDATLGFSATNPWSVAAYHRCFWGKSVAFGGTSSNLPLNHSYNEIIKAELGTALYTLPNTPTTYEQGAFTDPMKSYLTKIMVAARLAYTDGGKVLPAEICTYKGQKFLGKDNVKKVIARELRTYFKKTTSAAGDTYTQIETSDIDFSSKVTSTSGLKLQNYQVVADLRSGLTELYQKKGGNFEQVNVETVRAEMQQAPVEISNGGRTYYYTPIKHLGKKDSEAEYGVVRNHSYQVEISSIKGFGTPVYDPDEVTIIPTLPSDDLTYLAAKISVLSWRVVSDKVNLDKTE